MEGQRLILNDGTMIENGRAGYSEGYLWLYFTGYTLPEAGSIFFDQTKTASIIFQYGEMEDVYNGFTVCRNLMIDMDGNVSVCMVKGNGNA